MKRLRWIAGAFLILIFACSCPLFAASISCTECGMAVDMNSKFTARFSQGETTRYFCDIGDLFSYFRRNKTDNLRIEVKDYFTGTWLDARTAFYVHSEKKFKSPMGWGIAAFQDKVRAAESGDARDFEAMTKALK
jgi:nitrous oxide reductase accessory protein NosL